MNLVPILFALTTLGTPTEYRPTDVFQPLQTSEVRLAEDGSVFVLSFPEATIHIYDAHGQKRTTIGGKGKGPGEFIYPTQFWYEQGFLFVFDFNTAAISKFKQDGTFLERFQAPDRNIVLEKVHSGWVYGTWEGYGSQNVKPSVIWSDETFSRSETLLEIDKAGTRSGLTTWYEDGQRKGAFYPIQNQPNLVVSRDGRTLFVSHVDRFQIDIIDIEKRTLKSTIKRHEKRIPFDTKWADQRFEWMTNTPDFANVRWSKHYPDSFPIIRSLQRVGEDLLVVDRWRGDPEVANHYVTLTPDGTQVEKHWNGKLLVRYIGEIGKQAYLTAWDQNTEEAFVVKVRKADAGAYVSANPIVYDGPRGRDVQLTN